MKNQVFNRVQKSGKILYHLFAVTGMITVCGLLISWGSTEGSSSSSYKTLLASPDVNITTVDAAAMIEAYRWRVNKNQDGMPRGYFISKESINWLLQNQAFNGIYVYPAYNNAEKFCTVVEGGKSTVATYRILEGIDGRRIMSESTCPTDCGTLTR
jgi:hypothetical protein